MNLLSFTVALLGIVALYLTTNLHAEPSLLHASSTNPDLFEPLRSPDAFEAFTEEQKLRGLVMVTRGLNRFASNFFKNISITMRGNFVCSPLSVSLALSMAVYGSRRDTKIELVKLLGITKKHTYVARAGFRTLLDDLSTYKNLDLRVVNKVYVAPDGIRPMPKFTYVTAESHHTTTHDVDPFYTRYDRTRIEQKWLATRGNDDTAHIISMSDFGFNPMLVLANEIYLKSNSMFGFEHKNTHVRRFWENGIIKGETRSMFACRRYRYGRLPDVDAQFVEIPYQTDGIDDGVSMFILLPNRRTGLHKLQRRFERVTLERLYAGQIRNVHLYLPRFDIENFLWLETPLKNMGLETTFSGRSNFTKLVVSPFLSVRGGGHAASIQVKENQPYAPVYEGALSINHESEAADEQEIIRFMIDHPFIAVVATRSSHPVIIQIARVTGRYRPSAPATDESA